MKLESSLRVLSVAMSSLTDTYARTRSVLKTGERRLQVSFSSGETSAWMAQYIKNNWQDRYDKIIFVMANTSRENEESLLFARQCDEYFGLDLHLIEAVQYPGERKAPGGRRVTWETASRNGEVFEEAIKKYGIPNNRFPHCNRSLKTEPMKAYMRDVIGWAPGTYDTAIGIRADEITRVNSNAGKLRLVYPCAFEVPRTKPQINSYWRDMPFRLKLKGYQGNCLTCWKKTLRKHLTIIDESPQHFDFDRRMEQTYPRVGPEFSRYPGQLDRRFFRGAMTVDDLFAERARRGSNFVSSEDDARVYDAALDEDSGCAESCDAFSEQEEGVLDGLVD